MNKYLRASIIAFVVLTHTVQLNGQDFKFMDLKESYIHKFGPSANYEWTKMMNKKAKAKAGNNEMFRSTSEYFNSSTQSWTPSYITEYDYDLNGNQTREEGKIIDQANLIPDYKVLTNYNSNGHLISEEIFFYQNNQYRPSSRTEYIYNSSNQNVQTIEFNWDVANNNWRYQRKMNNTFNNGKLSLVNNFSWNSGNSSWTNSSRTTYIYNQNKLTQTLNENFSQGQWEESYRTLYTNNGPLGQISSFDSEFYSGGSWLDDTKGNYTYSSSFPSLESSYDSYIWRGSWISSTSEEYYYDQNGNTYRADFDDTYWTPFDIDTDYTQRDFEVDSVEMMINYIVPKWMSDGKYNFVNRLNRYYYYYGDDPWPWDIERRITMNYNNTTSLSNKTNIDQQLLIFPNPADDNLNLTSNLKLKGKKLTIMNIQGKIILEEMIDNNYQIKVSHLPSGYYKLIVETEKEILLSEFVKK